MKKINVVFVALLFTLLVGPVTYALDPGPRVRECWEEERAGPLSSDCQQVICEWNNTARNWPDDTGYHEECGSDTENKTVQAPEEKTEDRLPIIIAGTVLVCSLGVAFLLLVRHKKASRKK